MDATLIAESRRRSLDAQTITPQRQLARSYREHPLGRIRMGTRHGR